jgi:hypothetical protein
MRWRRRSAHECGHLAARDNLKRTLLRCVETVCCWYCSVVRSNACGRRMRKARRMNLRRDRALLPPESRVSPGDDCKMVPAGARATCHSVLISSGLKKPRV